jgi:hypothetical protein
MIWSELCRVFGGPGLGSALPRREGSQSVNQVGRLRGSSRLVEGPGGPGVAHRFRRARLLVERNVELKLTPARREFQIVNG